MMKNLFRKSLGLILLVAVFFTFSGCGILPVDMDESGSPGVEEPSGSGGPNDEIPDVEIPDSEIPDSEIPDIEIPDSEIPEGSSIILEDGHYTGKDEVAEYIHIYGRLPKNYITKNEAMDLGWDASRGNLWDVTDEMSIGGDRFGNREGLLPDASGRKWYEADIDYEGGRRNAKRIVFSDDGLIYYTDDHYESFEKLY